MFKQINILQSLEDLTETVSGKANGKVFTKSGCVNHFPWIHGKFKKSKLKWFHIYAGKCSILFCSCKMSFISSLSWCYQKMCGGDWRQNKGGNKIWENWRSWNLIWDWTAEVNRSEHSLQKKLFCTSRMQVNDSMMSEMAWEIKGAQHEKPSDTLSMGIVEYHIDWQQFFCWFITGSVDSSSSSSSIP